MKKIILLSSVTISLLFAEITTQTLKEDLEYKKSHEFIKNKEKQIADNIDSQSRIKSFVKNDSSKEEIKSEVQEFVMTQSSPVETKTSQIINEKQENVITQKETTPTLSTKTGEDKKNDNQKISTISDNKNKNNFSDTSNINKNNNHIIKNLEEAREGIIKIKDPQLEKEWIVQDLNQLIELLSKVK